MEELWRDVNGYEGLYQISNLGRVKSLKRKNKYKHNEEIIMKELFDGNYLFIRLSKNSKKKNFLIHRLVAEAFIKEIKGKEYVNHKNGIKTDNRVENLEWVTASENTIHAIKNGLKRLPNKKIIQIDNNKIVKHWNSIKEASETLGINRANIGACCRNERKRAGNYIWKYEGGI